MVVLDIFSDFCLIFFLWFFQRRPDSVDWSGVVDWIRRAQPQLFRLNHFKLRVFRSFLFTNHFLPLICHILFNFHSPNPSYLLSINFSSFNPFLTFQFPQILKTPKTFKTLIVSSHPLFNLVDHGSKVGLKCKGNEKICEDSPLHYDHSTYPSQESFDRYSTRTITFRRIINFSHLDFIGFNQLMRRMRWLTFARLSKPSYPSLIRLFYANLSRPHNQRLYLVATIGDIEIELEPSSMCRI